jgi:glycosyltransferase involved in cell wall biosynthesis
MRKVVFLHPDLGIGGAKRLVVDAALPLKGKGYDGQFVSHHDSQHCFVRREMELCPLWWLEIGFQDTYLVVFMVFDNTTHLPLNQILTMEFPDDGILFLSISQYERKKNLKLSSDAMNELTIKKCLSTSEWSRVHLVMAGVKGNVEHYDELVSHASKLGLTERVTIMKSTSDIEKISLLIHCHCLIYTPQNEHFSIVPIEAMYASKPVIAASSGGPT